MSFIAFIEIVISIAWEVDGFSSRFGELHVSVFFRWLCPFVFRGGIGFRP